MNGPAPAPQGPVTPQPHPVAGAARQVRRSAPLPPLGTRLAPRNWRVSTRLRTILLLPVLAGLVLGGWQVSDALDARQAAQDTEHTTRVVRAALTYSERLSEERDISAGPLLRGARGNQAAQLPDVVVRARTATDKAADAFDTAVADLPHTTGLWHRLAAVRTAEPGLSKLRADAYTSRLDGVRTEEGYATLQRPLMAFADALGSAAGDIARYGPALSSLALAEYAVSLQRALGTRLLDKPGPDAADLSRQRAALGSYAHLEGVGAEAYRSGATERDAGAAFSAAMRKVSDDAARTARNRAEDALAKGERYVPPPPADKTVAALAALPGTGRADRTALARQGINAGSWWEMSTARFDAYRQIESGLADRATAESASEVDGAGRAVLGTTAVVLVALLAALALAGLLARQMKQGVRRLRTAAFEIAEQRLPMLVDQLSRTAPGRVDPRAQPVPVFSFDEIGEVARAFDQVHREAVRLAAEQAVLRGNVHTIFADLSHRNASLIDDQLALIEELQSKQADPDQLAGLTLLDHLATRMRRTDENLLVLSGTAPARRWDRPVPLLDVLRAACAQVARGHRIELAGAAGAELSGDAVADVVHLLAELLENATAFSSPETTVRLTTPRLPDGRIAVEIHDRGVGLAPEDIADINHKLAKPPAVDASVARHMGLSVVGRLADRHGIRVHLRPAGEHGGTVSLVMLPAALAQGGIDEPGAGAEFATAALAGGAAHQQPSGAAGSRPAQAGPRSVPSAELRPRRTAAELGFTGGAHAGHPAHARGPDPADPATGPLPRGQRPTAPHTQARVQTDGTATATAAVATAMGHGDGPVPPVGRTGQGPDGIHGHAHAEAAGAAGADRAGAAQGRPLGEESGSQSGSHQGEWAHQGGFRMAGGIPPGRPAESRGGADRTQGNDHDRVGFDRHGPAPRPASDTPHEMTDAGLPRRGIAAGGSAGGQGAEGASPSEPQHHHAQSTPAPGSRGTADAGATSRAGGPSRGGASRAGGAGERAGEGERRGEFERGRESERGGGFDHGGEFARAGGIGRGAAAVPGSTAGGHGPAQPEPDAWRSANDERWARAGALRVPRAGGVTSSGLPRRVPRANLVAGSAASEQAGSEAPHQDGRQVSRTPEDVQGRLSRLRRGVREGHSEGSDRSGRAMTDPYGGQHGPDGMDDQER